MTLMNIFPCFKEERHSIAFCSLALCLILVPGALSAKEIVDYIATGEPFDKAGAYGIQGIGGGFITLVEGSRDNVMGLPTNDVIAALKRHEMI